MTSRRSKREIENAVEDLDPAEEFTVQDLLMAAVRDCYDSGLTSAERRLVDTPEAYLSPEALELPDHITPPSEREVSR
jgi:hypothetical protein